jgi:hypothetical protein
LESPGGHADATTQVNDASLALADHGREFFSDLCFYVVREGREC